MKAKYCLITALLWTTLLQGQQTDILIRHARADEQVRLQLFDHNPLPFSETGEVFAARPGEVATNVSRLTVSGDFTGDGLSELVLFGYLNYTPNMNPHFTCTVATLYRSAGSRMLPSGTWYKVVDSLLYLDYVNFATAGDFNRDGLDDIALFYNDPASDTQTIYVLESTGAGFSELKPHYTITRNEFNFTAIEFACAGDFNGDGSPDIAVLYNYFGTDPLTPQAVFLFESNGSTISSYRDIYTGTKQELDFSAIRFALCEDYNLDGKSDIAVLYEDTLIPENLVSVFEASETGDLTAENYLIIPGTQLSLSQVTHALSGEFADEQQADLLLLSRDPATEKQEVLVLEGRMGTFLQAEIVEDTPLTEIPFNEITSLQKGNFVHEPLATPTLWKDDRKGAISFTFDDGTLGAFENGAPALEEAGLAGTFYVFTDTTLEYDAPVAGFDLMLAFHEKGFEIGSHTINHSNLGFITAENPDSLSELLKTSVEELNQLFGQQTSTLSIPFGSFRQKTLDSLSNYFFSARSSQFGFNLPTPLDFYALRSWPILSTTSPEYVDQLVSTAESYGYYLPLMYHDILDEPFDQETKIYAYSLDLFRETIRLSLERDVWIDTHARVYKYIREREALKVEEGLPRGEDGAFSLIMNDHLNDSIFDVELTLRIAVPEWWGEQASVRVGDSLWNKPILGDEKGDYILFNQIPSEGLEIFVARGIPDGIGEKTINETGKSLSLRAFPNPFHKETTIDIKGDGEKIRELLLMDLQGRIVERVNIEGNNPFKLSGDKLAPGVYFLSAVGLQGEMAYLKILKN